jgi:malate/lactate dehydrogenase
MPKNKTITYVTRLNSLASATATIQVEGLSADEIKKQARVAMSVRNTTETLGFLHANLLKIDGKYFLLAGPSGAGKSTYARHLGEIADIEVLANDWVAVERDGEFLYASTLNTEGSLKHKHRCHVAGIVFLTLNDPFDRDAFVPNDAEYEHMLKETFSPSTGEDLARLQSFWLKNKPYLPFYCALTARGKPEAYITKTLQRIIQKAGSETDGIEVGIIGVGAIGTELAMQLGRLPFVRKVHLYSRTLTETKGRALDMNHAIAPHKSGMVYVAHEKPEDVFAHASHVFLTFRNEVAKQLEGLPDRWARLPAHLVIMKRYAAIASSTDFGGTVFVVSNPVDILTYACHAAVQEELNSLRTHQVYGVGLELDAARALWYSHQLNTEVTLDDITLYGNHADTFVLKTTLGDEPNAALVKAVQSGSADVRSYVPRPIYGPVAAAVRTLQASVQDGSAYVTVIQNNAHMGRKVAFRHGLPMFGEDHTDSTYQQLLEKNQQAIADYKHLL